MTIKTLQIATLILLLLLVFALCIHTITWIHQDIGRHITIGRIIWETKAVPGTNLFSYTNPDFPFINHHWLGEVFLYFSSVLIGLKGMIVAKAFLVTTAFALALFAFYRSASAFWSILIGLVAAFILLERTEIRPEVFSFLFLGWYLFILFRKQDGFSISNPSVRLTGFQFSKYALWTLPLVQLLWVNTHIYFFLGPVLYLFFLIGEYVRTRRLLWRDEKILVGLAIAGMNFINPFFWRGALYPLFVFQNYGYSVIENQTPFFLKAFGYPQLTAGMTYAGIVLVALTFIFNYRNFRRNLFGFLVFAAASVLALMMVRNFPILAFVMIPVGVKNMFEFGLEVKSFALWVAAPLLLAALIYSMATNQIYDRLRVGKTFGLHVPQGEDDAIRFVRKTGLAGPMFNNFDIGSFLIWKLPEEKVFIDGRPEAYPADFIQQVYIPMQEDQASWRKYSEQYRINFVFWNRYDITPWSQTFVRRMVQDRNWPLVYRDDSTLIFLKRTPENEPLIPKPATL